MDNILAFIGGIFCCAFIAFFGGANLISTQYECSKYDIVGKSPHRTEACTQYSLKEATNGK